MSYYRNEQGSRAPTVTDRKLPISFISIQLNVSQTHDFTCPLEITIAQKFFFSLKVILHCSKFHNTMASTTNH